MPERPEELFEKNKMYYERNAGRYEAASWYYFNSYKEHAVIDELKTCLRELGGRVGIRVLEIGPGTGYLIDKLIRLAGRETEIEYVAIEHSDAMAQILKERHETRLKSFTVISDHVSPELTDRMGWAGQFDIVMGSSILHHLPDYSATVRSLAHAVAPGGVLYFVREPIHISECMADKYPLTGLLDKFYSSVNAMLMTSWIRTRLWPGKVKAEDATGIACHMFGDGISTGVFQELMADGFTLVFNRKYNRRLSGLMSYLENKWLAALRKDIHGNTLFSICVRKNQK